MKLTRRRCLALGCGVAATLAVGCASARTSVVKVSLWDKGAMSMNMPGRGPMMGMGVAGGPTHMGPMGITVSATAIAAGPVTFDVTNVSREMVHEMVIAAVKDASVPLPYNRSTNKVDEDAAGHLGEVADLEPGKSGAITLTLKPGQYILYCNISGHYALGMWTLVTVK